MTLPSTDAFGRTITQVGPFRYRVSSADSVFEVGFPEGTPDQRILDGIQSHVPLAEGELRAAPVIARMAERDGVRRSAAAMIARCDVIIANQDTLTTAQIRTAIGDLALYVKRLTKLALADLEER